MEKRSPQAMEKRRAGWGRFATPEHPARNPTGNRHRQVSWLTGPHRWPSLPSRFGQWRAGGATRCSQLRGQPWNWRPQSRRTRFPFHPHRRTPAGKPRRYWGDHSARSAKASTFAAARATRCFSSAAFSKKAHPGCSPRLNSLMVRCTITVRRCTVKTLAQGYAVPGCAAPAPILKPSSPARIRVVGPRCAFPGLGWVVTDQTAFGKVKPWLCHFGNPSKPRGCGHSIASCCSPTCRWR